MHGRVMRWRRRWRVDHGLLSPLFDNVARLGPSGSKFKLTCNAGSAASSTHASGPVNLLFL